MNKTIFRAVLLACCIVMIFSLVGTLFFLNSYFTSLEMTSLREQLDLTATIVNRQGLDYFNSFQSDVYRLTWIDSQGDVIIDTQADEETMENHLDRTEVAQALRYGRGEDRRLSDTLSQETLYCAVRLSDGTVLRLSLTQHSVFRMTLGVIPYMLIILFLALLLCTFISRSISKKIIEPLNTLDLENPLDNETYEELSPLLVRIDNQNRQIQKQIDTIRYRQKEFEAITNNMREGMIILNSSDIIVSLNSSAMKLFGSSSDAIGKNILVLERSLDFLDKLQECKEKGRSEYFFEKKGFENRLIANRISDDAGNLLGTCLLIVDETEKVRAEGMRRQFSANVSHELKTPLHSILAASELLMNNLVKEEDKQTFISRIHSEAEHLVTLIQDIIRLSQLDESKGFVEEEVNFKDICQTVVMALEQSAEEKEISISCDVDDVSMMGVQRLVYEIIYNLCDNAIRYGRKGGYVKLSVKKKDDEILLAVEDNGIGIPPEHQERIFERFYRVDASHSRSTGGTGLGLSIVKHATMTLHGSIKVESEEDKGSIFTVSFPVKEAE